MTGLVCGAKGKKGGRFGVWFGGPGWGEPAYLYVTAGDKIFGQLLEAPPILLQDYEDAFPLVSSLSCTKGVLKLKPRKSFRAGLSTNNYATPLEIPLSEFAVRK